MADRHSALRAWSIEGTGGYGAGLVRHLGDDELVIELDRPNRPARHNGAKSDPLDAVRAGHKRSHGSTSPSPAPPESAEGFLDATDRCTEALLAAAHNPALVLYAELTNSLLRDALLEVVLRWERSAGGVDTFRDWCVEQYDQLIAHLENADVTGAEVFWRGFLQQTGVAVGEQPAPITVYLSSPEGDSSRSRMRATKAETEH